MDQKNQKESTFLLNAKNRYWLFIFEERGEVGGLNDYYATFKTRAAAEKAFEKRFYQMRPFWLNGQILDIETKEVFILRKTTLTDG